MQNLRKRQEPKSVFVHKIFDQISANYDLVNQLMSFGLHSYWRRRTVELLHLKKGDTALDIACGTGDLTNQLGEVVGRKNAQGLDFVSSMVSKAKDKYPDLSFTLGDCLAIPFADNSYTACTIAFALRNVNDVNLLIQEMKRVVKPGGLVCSLELTRPDGIFGFFHKIFLKLVIPFLGRFFSGYYKPYKYLCDSILNFVSKEKVCEIMRDNGLEDVEFFPLSLGIVTVHIGRKPLNSGIE